MEVSEKTRADRGCGNRRGDYRPEAACVESADSGDELTKERGQ